MKKTLLLCVVLLVGMLGSVAWADTVSYSTNWNLSVSPTSQTGFINTMNLAFLGIGTSSLHNSIDAPSNAPLGTFVITGWFGSDTFVNVPFTLSITQYVPTAGNAAFTSLINGTIKLGKSTAKIVFDQSMVTIGNVIYELTDTTYTLNADSALLPGVTSIQAKVSVVPEPGSLILLGSGLLGMGGYLRRRVFAA